MKFSPKKWPSFSQWRQFFKILGKKERIAFLVCLSLFLVSFSYLFINFYLKNTEIKPAEGGSYIEGTIGSPRYIQPIYAPANDADRDLVELIFSGLVKQGPDGEIIPDLAEDYNILDDGKTWEFHLKKNISWSDGKPLTADDVIFTIQAIQNQNTKSPLRANWLGVETEKISELGIRFKLKNPSSVFLENCQTKIIPEHIWKEISPENFPLTPKNLSPVGSGPYKLKNLTQNKEGEIISVELVRNTKYYGPTPNLKKISFKFFDDEQKLIKAYQSGEIQGFSLVSGENLPKNTNGLTSYSFSLPRYFAVFFNLNAPANYSGILKDSNVRLALNYGTNKEEILDKALSGKGEVSQSPVLPEIYGFEGPSVVYQFDKEKAEELLDKTGYKKNESGMREKVEKKTATFQFKSNLKLGSQGTEVKELQKCLARFPEIYPEGEITGIFGDKTKAAVILFQEKYREEILVPNDLDQGNGEIMGSTRKKLNEVCFDQGDKTIPLKIVLSTVDQPQLVEVANILKEQWKSLGVDLEVKTFDIASLERDVIRYRDYEAILFGEILGIIPDPFPFWHSSQKKDPGLNLSEYENKDCDKLLETARQSLDEIERETSLEKFQNLLLKDAPAVFLYTPDYLYFVAKEIKGVDQKTLADPSKRFSNVENWYIETKRAWK